jgi:uncharacterized protein
LSNITINIKNEQLTLMSERAVYWASAHTLFIADPHFGKTATFRAYGIPLPEGSMAADLQRLTQALNYTRATTLIILGDMLHTAKGRDEQTLVTFSTWRKQHPEIELLLIRGNHDKKAGDPPDAWGVRCVDAPMLSSPFTLSHIPLESDSGYVLAGHLHPAVQLVGKGRQTLKLPCFRFGAACGILPAFGSFIDHTFIKPAPHDRIYGVTPAQVFAL